MIYLATPYSDRDPEVVESRYKAACTHPIASVCALPKDWAYWERFCTEFISASEKVVVVMLPGWETSVGVQAEIRIAENLGKPIVYLNPTTFEGYPPR